MCNKVEDAKAFYDNVSAGDEVYLSDNEYIDLLMAKKAVQRVRELAEEYEDSYSGYHLATKILAALDGEQSE